MKQSIKTSSSTKKDRAVPAKREALEAAFAQIDKQFGRGSVMMLGQTAVLKVETISTGSLLIDQALGVGGLPRGRVVEIYGPEASGKTTFTLQFIAEAQKVGGTCAFIDAEHAIDPSYARQVGIDLDKLIISQPDFGEQALDIAEVLIRSNAVDVVVIDSVAALVPKSELEGEMGDHHVGVQARLMSQALRKLTPLVHKSRTVLVFINQIRHKIGGLPFANKETTTGGNALKFYSSVRLEVRRIATLKKGDKPFGNRVAVKVVKNKVAPPFKRIEADLIFGKGIVKELDLLDAGIQEGVIKQSGSWFTLGDERIAQGRDKCLKRFQDDTTLYEKVYSMVSSAIHASSSAGEK